MPPINSLNILFNNYKFSTSRQYKSFYTKYDVSLIPILFTLKRLGYVYFFTLNTTKTYFKIYPRYSHRFLRFQAFLKKPLIYLDKKQITKLRVSGYNFILYSSVFKGQNKFITSYDIYSNAIPGYLILKWLNSIQLLF